MKVKYENYSNIILDLLWKSLIWIVSDVKNQLVKYGEEMKSDKGGKMPNKCKCES